MYTLRVMSVPHRTYDIPNYRLRSYNNFTHTTLSTVSLHSLLNITVTNMRYCQYCLYDCRWVWNGHYPRFKISMATLKAIRNLCTALLAEILYDIYSNGLDASQVAKDRKETHDKNMWNKVWLPVFTSKLTQLGYKNISITSMCNKT